jgi:DNA invertase Pin-like site-specific DNA recombinase
MSFRQGPSSGTSTIDKAGSQMRSPHVTIAQPTQRGHPSGRASGDGVSPGPRSSQPPEPTSTRDGHASALEPTLASAVNGSSRGASPDHARADHSHRNLPAVVLGYASADAQQQDRASADLRWQVDEITSECERLGLRLLAVVREQERQHRRPLERPGLGYAVGRIAAGEARGLVVSDLFRVSHSLAELGRVLEWLALRDARFVAAAPRIDSDEEAGLLALRTIIDLSRWERRRLAERTRSGMEAARRKGPASVADHPELRDRIAAMRAEGMTLQAIADQLNADGIPTVRGGAKWRPSSVQAAAGYHRPTTDYAVNLSSPGTVDLRPADAIYDNWETEEAKPTRCLREKP